MVWSQLHVRAVVTGPAVQETVSQTRLGLWSEICNVWMTVAELE